MKHTLFLSVVILSVINAIGQDQEGKQWFKGNLHTHSLWSDGDGYPEMIIEWYQARGYHFVALSDHNILAHGEKWVKVPKSKMHEDAFQNYLTRFGDEWVEQKIDSAGRISVKLKTYEEYQERFQRNDFIMLKSEEITDQYEKKPIHINATNVQELIPAQGGSSVRDVMQRSIDAVSEQRSKTGVPMFTHINHPNFYYAISVDDMIALKGERFFEVYNGHPLVQNEGDSLHIGTEEMWDRINMAYRRRGQEIMYGIATDEAGRGWVMVHSDKLAPEALISAMEAGEFYASTGVELEELKTRGNTLHVRIKAEQNVSYSIEFTRCTGKGEIVKEIVRGVEATASIKPTDLFLRAKVISSKARTNPVNDVEYETAWIQPIIFSKAR